MTLVLYLSPKAFMDARYNALLSWRNSGINTEFYHDRLYFTERLRTGCASNACVVIREDEVNATPSFGAPLDADYITGLAKTGGVVRVLLDMNKALGGGSLSMRRAAA